MNKLTQQQVFSLYLANPEQRVRYKDNKIYDMTGLSYAETCELCSVRDKKGESKVIGWRSISDCKLISKRISDITLDACRECGLYVWGDLLEDNAGIVIKDYLTTGYAATLNFTSTRKINEWLITHGYCLDEQWVKDRWVEVE